jgi:hypothetical protein
MNVKIDDVIWQLAKVYREEFIAKHPDKPISMSFSAVVTFLALRASGRAVEELDADGNSTLKATPKLLRETGLEPGRFVTLGLGVH